MKLNKWIKLVRTSNRQLAKKLDVSSPIVMGILNVTPDSFSDGGKYIHTDDAVHKAIKMIDEGASIIDIGGYSSRPGAKNISEDEVKNNEKIIQDYTDNKIKIIDERVLSKEKEIMTI